MKFELSLNDLKELILGEKSESEKLIGASDNLGEICLIRTYSAGIHFGRIEDYSKCVTVVKLSKARRIWNWKGANTLHEISKDGISSDSKVSEEIDSITISGVIEIIPMTQKAIDCLEQIKWS